MIWKRAVLLLLVGALVVETSRAEPCLYYRNTLLSWNGDYETGGPDLSEPLVADRPDFTEASSTVGCGVVELEMGYTYLYDSEPTGTTRTHAYPQTLLRVGALAEWLEFRIDWNWLDQRTNDLGGNVDTISGAEDLGVGVKIALTPHQGWLPETGVILETSVPTGASELTAGDLLPGVDYLYGWDLSEDWSLGGESLFERALDEETDNSYLLFAQSFSLGHEWTDRIGSYAEWFALIPAGADTDPTQHYFNGGFTVLINNNFMWDAEAGLGLNAAATDYFVGTGLSIRWY